MKFGRSHKGFTLVEIIVVVSIIGLLASIGGVNYNESRKEARDARRIQDLGAIATALKLYQIDTGRKFECENGFKVEPGFLKVDGTLPTTTGTPPDCQDYVEMQAALTKYLPTIPADPLGSGDSQYFFYVDVHVCPNSFPALVQQSDDYFGLVVFAAMEDSGSSNAAEVCGFIGTNPSLPINNSGYMHWNPIVSKVNTPYVIKVND